MKFTLLSFFDISGRIAHEESIPYIPGQKIYNFEKRSLNKGLFAYRINSNFTLVGSGKKVVE